MERISTSPRYNFHSRTGFALFGELEEGGVQGFGEFVASGRVRTMEIGRRVGDLHKLT